MHRALAILLVIAGLFLIWPSPDPSPEDQIRSSVERIAEATRRGRAGDFMDEIAVEFSDPAFTRKALHGMLLREFLNGGGTAVHLGPIDVTVNESVPSATAVVTASFPGAFLETTLKATELRFELNYAIEEGSWRIFGQRNNTSSR